MRALLAAWVLLGAPVGASRAQDVGASMGGSCVTQKLHDFCPGAKPGTPAFADCSTKHLAEANGACGQMRPPDAPDPTQREFDPKNPCADDVDKFCAGKRAAEIASCLDAHRSRLMPACAASRRARTEPDRGEKTDDPCAPDAEQHCPGLTAHDGRPYDACLANNSATLSPACRDKLGIAGKTKAGRRSKRGKPRQGEQQLDSDVLKGRTP